jgi:hypothetical protein
LTPYGSTVEIRAEAHGDVGLGVSVAAIAGACPFARQLVAAKSHLESRASTSRHPAQHDRLLR